MKNFGGTNMKDLLKNKAFVSVLALVGGITTLVAEMSQDTIHDMELEENILKKVREEFSNK